VDACCCRETRRARQGAPVSRSLRCLCSCQVADLRAGGAAKQARKESNPRHTGLESGAPPVARTSDGDARRDGATHAVGGERAGYRLQPAASLPRSDGSLWHKRAPTLDGAVPRSGRSVSCLYAIGRSMVRIESATSTFFFDGSCCAGRSVNRSTVAHTVRTVRDATDKRPCRCTGSGSACRSSLRVTAEQPSGFDPRLHHASSSGRQHLGAVGR
jgi:hypothetical protein